MVDLFITGSIHTNTGTRIAVDLSATADGPDLLSHLEDLIEESGHSRNDLSDMRIDVMVKSKPTGYEGINFFKTQPAKKNGISVGKVGAEKEGLPSISQMADNLRRWNDSRPTMAQVEENCKRWGGLGLRVKDFS